MPNPNEAAPPQDPVSAVVGLAHRALDLQENQAAREEGQSHREATSNLWTVQRQYDQLKMAVIEWAGSLPQAHKAVGFQILADPEAWNQRGEKSP